MTPLEEPTIPDDAAGRPRIVRQGGVPVATQEILHALHEFIQMISAGGATFPEPDVVNRGGGVGTVFMKVAHLVEAFNLPVTSHGAHDVTVRLLAAAGAWSGFRENAGGALTFLVADVGGRRVVSGAWVQG